LKNQNFFLILIFKHHFIKKFSEKYVGQRFGIANVQASGF